MPLPKPHQPEETGKPIEHIETCMRCGTKVERFQWVYHFRNAYFWGCPRCYPASNYQTGGKT